MDEIITIEHIKEKTPERFWSKIKFDEPNKCWEWQASITNKGYGSFGYGVGSNTMGAHRYLFMKLFGELSYEIKVCHTCDNPKCVNPNHLWHGTQKQNIHDMDIKGRRNNSAILFGSNHSCSKINEHDVLEIKRMILLGEDYKSIGNRFSLSDGAIGLIKRGKNWKHVKLSDEEEEKLKALTHLKGEDSPRAKLTEIQVRQILSEYKNGKKMAEIAVKYNTTLSTVNNIVLKRRWAHIK